jgi:hypothetical protein
MTQQHQRIHFRGGRLACSWGRFIRHVMAEPIMDRSA